MKLVIDIPEHLQEACKDAVNFGIEDDFQLPANVVRAIANSKSLDSFIGNLKYDIEGLCVPFIGIYNSGYTQCVEEVIQIIDEHMKDE